jgi:hypothetical protein
VVVAPGSGSIIIFKDPYPAPDLSINKGKKFKKPSFLLFKDKEDKYKCTVGYLQKVVGNTNEKVND